MSKKIVAIVGSYRKGGTVDRMVEAVLDVAREKGAETHTVYLTEQRIEFCTNCRQCTQTPGVERGKCAQQDGMEAILQEIEAADAVVLGSPVNYYNVTAIFRRFMERLLGYAYWPWGQSGPGYRSGKQPRKAVLVASAGMPGFLIPIATGAPRALRLAAKMLGARPVDSLWIGLASGVEHPPISARNQQRARRMGMRLAY
jgi:NAD(P)H-dependent FMN reductase